MKSSEIIEAIKEFFFDILGFFIPGFITILILSICVTQTYSYESSLLESYQEMREVILFVFCYVLGYMIYSLTFFRDSIFKWRFLNIFKITNEKTIEEEIKNATEYKLCIKLLTDLWKTKGQEIITSENLNNFSIRQTRSAVMSYIPEADTKIYTFMFRADLCNQMNTITFFVSILGLTIGSINYFLKSDFIFKSDFYSFLFYIFLFISSIFFYKTRIRFLRIALKIPFTIFIAKCCKLS